MTPLERAVEIQSAVNALLTETKEAADTMSVADGQRLYRLTREIGDQLAGIRMLLDPRESR